MKTKTIKFITSAILLVLAVLFLVKFGGASLLKAYVQIGVGDCQKIPVLCLAPDTEITNPAIDRSYQNQLILYKFPKMQIYLPKGFNVVQEEIKEFYYTKGLRKYSGPVIYMFYQKPGYFIKLFPQVEKLGIATNYVFIGRTMYAQAAKIKNLSDTFFAILKTIFTPNLGDQKNIKMAKFFLSEHKGYITYNLGLKENYFACDVIDSEDGYFKIYIKDKDGALDLGKVFAIVSTAKKQE